MKKIILSLGGFFIELGAILQFLVLFGLSIAIGILIFNVSFSVDIAWLGGVVAFVILFILFIMGNYLFFMIINIHDSFVSIAKSLDFIAYNGTNQQRQITQSTTTNILKCPNCGVSYNNDENFCEKCGIKLN